MDLWSISLQTTEPFIELSIWQDCEIQGRLEDAGDASVFLQQDFHLRKDGLAAHAVTIEISRSQAVERVSDPPSKSGVVIPNLGVRVVDFGWAVFVPIVAVWVAVCLHERSVSESRRTLIGWVPLQRKACQIFCTWQSLGGFLLAGASMPLVLDYALSLEQTPTASGFFIGIQLVASVLGTLVGNQLVGETRWNQFFVRRLLLSVYFFTSLSVLALACFLNWTAEQHVISEPPTPNLEPCKQQDKPPLIICGRTAASSHVSFVWWAGFVWNFVIAFFGGIPSVIGVLLWTKVTNPGNRTIWTVIMQCSRSAGMAIGPVCFSLLSRAVIKGGDAVSPRSMMAWVCVFSTWINLVSLTICVFGLPTELPAALPEIQVSEAAPARKSGEARPEALEDPDRQTVYWKMFAHFCERPMTLAAIEVSITMMLELFYGWDAYHCGFCLTIMCPVGIVLAVAMKILINSGFLSESSVYFSAMLASVIGAAMLFDGGNAGAWTLIAGGTVIFSGALACATKVSYHLRTAVANGIADGWGSRAAKEGTSFGQAQFQLLKLLAIYLGNFAGDTGGRFLVDVGGRNTYAGAQLVLCLLGAHTAYGACRPLWAKQNEEWEAATEFDAKSSGCKLPSAPEDSPNPSERGMVVNTYPGRYSPTSDRPAPPPERGMMRAFAAASLKDCAALGPEIRRYFQKSFDREFLASVASRRDLWRILLPLPGIFAFVADRGDNELMIMNDRDPVSRELCGGDSSCRVVGSGDRTPRTGAAMRRPLPAPKPSLSRAEKQMHETICNLLSLPVEDRERCEIASNYTFTMACPAPFSPPGTLPTLQGTMEASTLDAAKVAAGFEHASGSQEEAIFRSSSLFLSLWPHRRKDDGPGVLKRGTWIGDFDELLPRKEPFYEHTECGGIYSPYVRLMASDAEVAVATVAAQDVTRSPPFRRELLREKIRTVLWMAQENGHDAVVLGAFGCGYFSNPAEVVAETFQQLLATEFSGVFRLALFALLRDRNFPVFTKYFPLLDAKRLPSLLESHTPAPKPKPE
eukprot:s33_g36.t3